MSGPGEMLAFLGFILRFSIGVGLTSFFFIFLLRVLVRRNWLAVFSYALIFSTMGVQDNPPTDNQTILWIVTLITNSVAPFILMRFGILPMITVVLVSYFLASFPLTFDLTTWYDKQHCLCFRVDDGADCICALCGRWRQTSVEARASRVVLNGIGAALTVG